MATIVFTLEDGQTITTPLDIDMITIGRAEDSIVQLPSASVSSHHAVLKAREDGYYVQDLGSRNGTRVNGATIEESILNDGDRVAFGDIQSVFYASDEVPAEEDIPVGLLAAPPIIVEPIVRAAPPVTGIPHGAGSFNPKPRQWQRRTYTGEGGGCMTAIILTLLFGGAFIVGLSLRHYKETNGGVLPNDFIKKVFGKIEITVKEEPKK